MVIIMWACICIILHNLIIWIKGDNFDERWRESLVRTGRDDGANSNADENDEPEDALKQARWRLETPGQHFWLKIMDDLFTSRSCAAERCP